MLGPEQPLSTLLTDASESATIHSMTTTQTAERIEAVTRPMPPLAGRNHAALRVRLALATPTDAAFAARLRAAQLDAIVTERLRTL